MQFRHFATKVGNLERPFVKEFFLRWVCSCGCPVLRYMVCDLHIACLLANQDSTHELESSFIES